jgi:hypothetical protein
MLPILLASVAFWGSVLGGGFYFVRRYVRAVESRVVKDAELLEMRQRILALEESLDATQRDVERLEAAQEFTPRLLNPGSGRSDQVT